VCHVAGFLIALLPRVDATAFRCSEGNGTLDDTDGTGCSQPRPGPPTGADGAPEAFVDGVAAAAHGPVAVVWLERQRTFGTGKYPNTVPASSTAPPLVAMRAYAAAVSSP
jgi:hypothetical protein